jgi:hypothetical protein
MLYVTLGCHWHARLGWVPLRALHHGRAAIAQMQYKSQLFAKQFNKETKKIVLSLVKHCFFK